jgi:hypothetical protein
MVAKIAEKPWKKSTGGVCKGPRQCQGVKRNGVKKE